MRHFGRIGGLVLLHDILIAQEGRTDDSDLEGCGRLLFVWRSLDHLGPQDRSCHTKVGYTLCDCLSLPVKLETRRIPEHAHSSLMAPLGVVE